jgi:hypothetical protein
MNEVSSRSFLERSLAAGGVGRRSPGRLVRRVGFGRRLKCHGTVL